MIARNELEAVSSDALEVELDLILDVSKKLRVLGAHDQADQLARQTALLIQELAKREESQR